MNKRIAGFAIIIITLISIAVWEFWGRENISYKSVLVLREDMNPHVVVSEEDFKVKKIESPSPEALTAEDLKSVAGMETSQFVSSGTELRAEYFENSKFSVGGDSGRALMGLSIEWLMSYPQTIRRGDQIILYNGTVKLMEGIVAHVKDSGGQEVTSADSQRLNSSAVPGHIEIIGDDGDLVEVSRLAGEGNRFTLITVR